MVALTSDVRGLLDGPNFAHVATILPDGGPHSVPVWIGTEGDRIVFFTQSGTRKARNLERDGRVALASSTARTPIGRRRSVGAWSRSGRATPRRP